ALSAAAAASFTNTVLGAQTIYVRVQNDATACYATAPINLSVAGQPGIQDLTLMLCEDPANPSTRANVDLTELDEVISVGNATGSYVVNWFTDAALTIPVTTPTDVMVSNGEIYYVQIVFVTGAMCENTAEVTINLDPAPEQMDLIVEVCEDETGTATINLVDYEPGITVGTGTDVSWYTDAAFTNILTDTNVSVDADDNGTADNTFYAAIDDGTCMNTAQITFDVSELPTVEAGADKEICARESVTLADAAFGTGITMGAWSIVTSPAGGDGVLSNGGTISDPTVVTFTATVSGVYELQLTSEDPAGPCEAVNDQVRVTVLPLPIAAFNPQDAAFCDGETVPAMTVNVTNTSLVVDWYIDPTATMPVTGATITGSNTEEITLSATSTPAAPTTGNSVTVYAQVRNPNTGCVSFETVAVTLTNNPLPDAPAGPQDAAYCTGEDIPTLSVLNPGTGFSIVWYTDATANTPVSGAGITGFNGESIILTTSSIPALPSAGNSVSVYAALVDNMTGCESTARTEVILTHNPLPVVANAQIVACETFFQSRQGIFDLTSVADVINTDFPAGGTASAGVLTSTSGTLQMSFHEFMSDATNGTNAISTPDSFTNVTLGSQTIFVRVEDTATGCVAIAQIRLSVSALPSTNDLDLLVCPDLASNDTRTSVDLTALENSLVSGSPASIYTVVWYTDAALTTPVADATDATITNGDVFYAEVTFNTQPNCSNVGTVTYTVQLPPPVMDITLEFCEDEPLQGTTTVNLRDNDLMVAAGMSAIVNWFEDDAFTIPVTDPTNVTVTVAGTGTEDNIYYAEVSDRDCTNRAQVSVNVFTQPLSDAGADKAICAGESIALDDASLVAASSATSAAWTIASQPMGGDGVVTPTGLQTDPSIATFTASVAGDYVLALTTDDPTGPCGPNIDEVIITVNPLPVAFPMADEVCVDSQVTVDGNPSGGTAPYVTHTWTDLGTGTATGYTLSNMSTQVVTVDATGATAGTVELLYVVVDSNGCSDDDNVTITIHPLPQPSVQDDMLCVGETLMLDGAPTGGTPAYITHDWVDLGTGTATGYTLSNLDMQVVFIDALAATDANAGTIELQYTVTDLNGCSNTTTVTVMLNALPEVTIDDANITCDEPRQVQLNATTTAAAPTYEWTGPSIIADETTATPTVDAPGLYTVTVTDGLTGCSNTAEVVVTQDPLSKCLPAMFEIKPKPRR
ncbi:MAG: hypothetical protein AAF738_04010, partial [Bacteroidota bacterium]